MSKTTYTTCITVTLLAALSTSTAPTISRAAVKLPQVGSTASLTTPPFILIQENTEDPNDERVNEGTTRAVEQALEDGRECDLLPPEYRIDCLKQTFDRAARRISPQNPAYSEARKVLRDTADQLDALVTNNLDAAAAPRTVGNKSARAVQQSLASSLNQRAAAIIQEAETKLLRASGSSQRRSHYARIAQAVGSTKTLLRS